MDPSGDGDYTDAGDSELIQTRAHNKANEIDNDDDHADAPNGSISGGNWVLPKQDARGNTIEGPKPGDETVKHKYVFNAWNRMVKVTDASDAVISESRYDGQGRRIAKAVDETTTHFFFNENWQVLETRVGADPDPLDQYVWDACPTPEGKA